MKTCLLLTLVLLSSSGCAISTASKQFKEFESLGITRATVTGKFSNTDYVVTREDGKRKAVLQHSNAWLPKVYIERETEE